MSVTDKTQKLRSLIRLLVDASEVVIKEWEAEEQAESAQIDPTLPSLPSTDLFNARRTVLGACGMCMDLVQEPQSRLMELANQFYSSRALHIAAEARIAEVLANADPNKGMSIEEINGRVGVEQAKLGKHNRYIVTVCAN